MNLTLEGILLYRKRIEFCSDRGNVFVYSREPCVNRLLEFTQSTCYIHEMTREFLFFAIDGLFR